MDDWFWNQNTPSPSASGTSSDSSYIYTSDAASKDTGQPGSSSSSAFTHSTVQDREEDTNKDGNENGDEDGEKKHHRSKDRQHRLPTILRESGSTVDVPPAPRQATQPGQIGLWPHMSYMPYLRYMQDVYESGMVRVWRRNAPHDLTYCDIQLHIINSWEKLTDDEKDAYIATDGDIHLTQTADNTNDEQNT